MANRFLLASIDAVKRNGLSCNYIKVQTGVYNVETGSVVNTETIYPVVMYKKHIKTSQYNFPNLIGKDVGVFYLANYQLTFTPSVKDKIFYDNQTYIVESFENCVAHSQTVLFKVVAVRT
jgi:restriction endonuclease S subunit